MQPRAAATTAGITTEELRTELKHVDARAFLVPLRLLRRVIRAESGLRRFGFSIPHRKSWVLGRARALELISLDELGVRDASSLPDPLILLIEPDESRLANASRRSILQRYWRLLFHARIHLALDELGLSDEHILQRVEAIGRNAFQEIRNVLRDERFLLPDASDRAVYVEFAAVFLELRFFAPHALAAYFPGLGERSRIEGILERDLPFDQLLSDSNLGRVDLPPLLVHSHHEPDEGTLDEVTNIYQTDNPDDARREELVRQAERASEKGNDVRAAILYTRALKVASGIRFAQTAGGARGSLDALIRRVRHGIEMTEVETKRWRVALMPLLKGASRGPWPREARLLYDLQKIAVEKEREVFAIDLVGWVTSLGRSPLKEPLPLHREARALKHLRDAAARLRGVRLSDAERENLGSLLELALHHAEHHLRAKFRPVIAGVLDSCDVVPRNAAERAGRRKMIEELIDKIVDHGFFRFGDLRDTFSRNQIKLPDLSGPTEFLKGDRLLRTDKALATALRGVYHRGEIYMRGLQRFSSLLFGTAIGRMLTCYVLLPVGGAFVTLEGLTHLVALFVKAADGVVPELLNPLTWGILSLVILGLVNSRSYRSLFWMTTKTVARLIGRVFIDIPRQLLTLPPVMAVLRSPPFRLGMKWVAKPLAVAWLLWSIFPIGHAFDAVGGTVVERNPGLPFAVFAAMLALLLNSRPGRDLEEILLVGASRLGRRLRANFITGLFDFIVRLFAALVEAFEKVLYGVDEDLRFRSGENKLVLVIKGVLGLIWSVLTYVVRIYVNLLIEPQINPIKHFPVVTVSHKIILPMTVEITRVIRTPFMPLGLIAANTISVVTVFLLPGIFGFLVWEFKENWKLYESNRSKRLLPERVGHHGETMRGFLRPGFHSGTIPRVFAQWRRAERRAQREDVPGVARKPREKLHHVEESIRRFVDRAILFLLEESRSFGPGKLAVGPIELTTNRVRVEILDVGGGRTGTCVVFEETDGVLSARLERHRWVEQLDPSPRNAIVNSLTGLFAMSQVERVPDGFPADFKDVEVPWNSWVTAWERDAAGLDHPVGLVSGCCILRSPDDDPKSPTEISDVS